MLDAVFDLSKTSLSDDIIYYNHDEVDLGRLSDEDRDQVYLRFGPDDDMRLYDRGIRRRLAPMLNNDLKFLELSYSLLFSLPGTPIVRYGEELGREMI